MMEKRGNSSKREKKRDIPVKKGHTMRTKRRGGGRGLDGPETLFLPRGSLWGGGLLFFFCGPQRRKGGGGRPGILRETTSAKKKRAD